VAASSDSETILAFMVFSFAYRNSTETSSNQAAPKACGTGDCLLRVL